MVLIKKFSDNYFSMKLSLLKVHLNSRETFSSPVGVSFIDVLFNVFHPLMEISIQETSLIFVTFPGKQVPLNYSLRTAGSLER